MTAKQCLRHEWLRGAPTQASPHLRRYLSKSREVLLERVVSRENLRRAALLSQASSNVNLSEQGLNCSLSQSEICLSHGLTGSRGSLPGSEDFMSPAYSRTSLNSSRTSLATSQCCLLNKEQTQGLLNQAQSRSQANLNYGTNRGLLSRMRGLNQVQSQACLLNDNKKEVMKDVLSPLLGRSREKLYGIKCLSKSQGVLDIYRSLECLKKTKKNQRARTEDMIPIFKQLGVQIASCGSTLQPVDCEEVAPEKNDKTGLNDNARVTPQNQVNGSEEDITSANRSDEAEVQADVMQESQNGQALKKADETTQSDPCEVNYGDDSEKHSEHKMLEVPKSPIPESEENLDSLQSIESDTLTEDSDETIPHGASPTSKQPSQRQHSDISSLSNNSGNSDDKEEHSDLETEEPKYSVAQLVSAFNKHQEVASKTSLEAIMSEKRVNEVNFPTGPKALRLFIPDIDISESTIVRRKTSYKPRKNWEELRKRNEKNEGILKSLSSDFGQDEDDEDDERSVNKDETEEEGNENVNDKDSEFRQGWSTFESAQVQVTVDGSRFFEESENIQENHDTRIDEKYKQCVEGARATNVARCEEKMSMQKNEYREKERIANYYPNVISRKNPKKTVKESNTTDNSVNLKDILLKVNSFETTQKENLENLRKRTSIAKIMLNDTAMNFDGDANNNGSSTSTSRIKLETTPTFEEERISLDVPPSFFRSSSLSSDSSCPTPSSMQSEVEMSWEDVRATRGSSMSLEKEDTRFGKRSANLWESQKSHDGRSRSAVNLEDKKIWGKVCTGTYTRAMEKFNGKNAEGRKASILMNAHQITEKTRRKSSPAMPQFLNS